MSTASRVEELQLRVGEMDCSSCLAKIERQLKTVDGVQLVQGSVVNRTVTVTLDRSRVTDARVQEEIGRVGYLAQPILLDAPPPPRASGLELGPDCRCRSLPIARLGRAHRPGERQRALEQRQHRYRQRQALDAENRGSRHGSLSSTPVGLG
jgi:copper chaperone CopZ